MGGVGLTRANGPKTSLLSTFRDRSRGESSGTKKKTVDRKRESPDIHAAPLSSDDSEFELDGPSTRPDSRDLSDDAKSVTGTQAKKKKQKQQRQQQQQQEEEEEERQPYQQQRRKQRPLRAVVKGSQSRNGPLTRNSASAISSSTESLSSSSPLRRVQESGLLSSSPKRPLDAITTDTTQGEDDDFELIASSQSQKRIKPIRSYGGNTAARGGLRSIGHTHYL